MYGQATLYDYWMALYTRKWIILLVSLSAMGFALAISYHMPRVYEVRATLFFASNAVPTSYTGSSQQRIAQPALKPMPDEKEAGVHIGVLRSTDMARRAQQRFPEKELSFFRKNVDFVTSPQFFTDIYVRDRNPQLAADIANFYVDAYTDFHADLLKQRAERSRRALEQELAVVQKEFVAKTAEISVYKQQNKLLSSGAAEQLDLNQAQQLERDRNDVTVELEALQTRIPPSVKRMDSAARGGDQSVIPNPLIERAQKLEARRNALDVQLAKVRNGTRGTVTSVTTLQMLESEKRILEERRSNVEQNLAEARIQSVSPQVDVVRVQTAGPPKDAAFPVPLLNAAVGLILGFGAACYVALLLDYLARLRVERIRRNLDESVLQEAAP